MVASILGHVARAEKEPDQGEYSGRVAARLRAMRKKKKMSREELWYALKQQGRDIKVPALYAYENGSRKIDPDLYPFFAKALGFKSTRDFLPPE